MKRTPLSKFRPGFTLIELLVAMAITVILLGVLVYLTGVSMDTYRDSSNEVRASRQAREALETIAKDLESMISRRDGNEYEWLYAGVDAKSGISDPTGPGGKEGQIANRAQLIFFTGATDRYEGEIDSGGGDVSAVSYRLTFRDQIGDTNDEEFAVFSLYRHLINPGPRISSPGEDNAFKDLLAQDDLRAAYKTFEGSDLETGNFLVENIYEFTVTLLVQYAVGKIERVTLRQRGADNYTEFRLKGDKIEAVGPKSSEIENGRIVGAEVSITVLSDRGVTLAKKSGIKREDLVKKYGYHYTKTITTPRP